MLAPQRHRALALWPRRLSDISLKILANQAGIKCAINDGTTGVRAVGGGSYLDASIISMNVEMRG